MPAQRCRQQDVARWLGCSLDEVHGLVAAGELECVTRRNERCITTASLSSYLDRKGLGVNRGELRNVDVLPMGSSMKFLWKLALRGKIALYDLLGHALDMNDPANGPKDSICWYVRERELPLIKQEFAEERQRQAEGRRRQAEGRQRKAEERRRQAEEWQRQAEERQRQQAEEQQRQTKEREEAARRQAKQQEEERRARIQAWKERTRQLKATGQWEHPLYKTFLAAKAEGWHRRRPGETGGEEMVFRGEVLVRDTNRLTRVEMARYYYKAQLRRECGLTPAMVEDLGPPDRDRVNPFNAHGRPARLYRVDRVEAWVNQNKERVEKAKRDRVKRSEAARQAHKRKRAEQLRPFIELMDRLEIKVVKTFPGILLKRVPARFSFRGKVECLQDQHLRGYIRRRFTNFKALWQEFCKQDYKDEYDDDLRELLQERVDAAVMTTFLEWKKGIEAAPAVAG